MRTTLLSLVIDAADIDAESAFWQRVLDASVTKTASHHFLQADGFPALVVQAVPGHVPPTWPDGNDQQLHFDLRTDDPAETHRLVMEAGGRCLEPDQRSGVRVYASPAGHPFCVRST